MGQSASVHPESSADAPGTTCASAYVAPKTRDAIVRLDKELCAHERTLEGQAAWANSEADVRGCIERVQVELQAYLHEQTIEVRKLEGRKLQDVLAELVEADKDDCELYKIAKRKAEKDEADWKFVDSYVCPGGDELEVQQISGDVVTVYQHAKHVQSAFNDGADAVAQDLRLKLPEEKVRAPLA